MLDTKVKKYLTMAAQSGLLRSLYKHPLRAVNFSHNDYLGLALHPALAELAIKYTEKFGAGSTASRVLGGNMAYHEQLEQTIAASYPGKQALIFASGFQANTTIISTLVNGTLHNAKPLVLADNQCHNSMITGCQLGNCRVYRYQHQNLEHLERLLQKPTTGPKFIMTETVFSMSGSVTNMAKLTQLAKQYNAYTIIDDAHGIGVMGPDGYGTVKEHIDNMDLVIGTFSKALGSFGAYCICSAQLKDYLINTCRGFIYTTAPSPAMVGAMQAGWDLIPTLAHERALLRQNVTEVKCILRQAGWSFGDTSSSIIPIYGCGDMTIAAAHQDLLKNNIITGYVRPPTNAVPMLRLTVSSKHNETDFDKLAEAII